MFDNGWISVGLTLQTVSKQQIQNVLLFLCWMYPHQYYITQVFSHFLAQFTTQGE